MSYFDEVMADSPVAYYRMDEASGLIQDSSGNGNNATVLNGTTPTYSEPGALESDPASTSIDFDLTFDTYFDIPSDITLDLGDVLTL